MSTSPVVFSPMAQTPQLGSTRPAFSAPQFHASALPSPTTLAAIVQPKFGINLLAWLEAPEIKRLKENPVAQQPELIGRMLLTLWQDNITGYHKPSDVKGLTEDSVREIVAGYKRDKGQAADHMTDAHVAAFIQDVKRLYQPSMMGSGMRAFREAERVQEDSLRHVALFMNYTNAQLNPVPRFDQIA